MRTSGAARSESRFSIGRIMGAVAYSGVVISLYRPESILFALASLSVGVPWMLTAGSRRDFLTAAGVMTIASVLICGMVQRPR